MKHRGYFEYAVNPTIDGKPCPYVVLEGPMAKRLAGLSLVQQDLLEVQSMLTRIDPMSNDIVGTKAMLFGALVLYGKCFTQADGRGVKLERKKIFSEDEARESHERMMQLRHEFVAHAGKAREEQLIILLLLNPDTRAKSFRGLIGNGVSAHGLDEQARRECLETVSHALAYVTAARKEAENRLLQEVTKNGIEWAYENAIWPDT